MADYAHEQTDIMLAQVESELRREYRRAAKETQKKLNDYLKAFKQKDKERQAQVARGELTQQEYNNWRQGQIIVGRRWEDMLNVLAEDMHNSNQIARSVVYGHLPEVYALNHNYGTFEIEQKAMIDTSYVLYDRQTVERLIRERPDLLPPPEPNSNVARAIAAGKDIAWNKKKVQSELLQGILQGEAITNLAQRMQNVTNSNYSNSVRYARTMYTGAQNAGRVDAYKRAEKMGIEGEMQWVATLDGRTRHSHRQLDGERIKIGGKFSNGCRYPGDPQGKPSEVYNCRCTLIEQMVGLEHDLSGRSLVKLDGKTYEEWKASKPKYTKNKK